MTNLDLLLPFLKEMNLDRWLTKPAVSDLMVSGNGSVWVEIEGQIIPIPNARISRGPLEAFIQIVARKLGQDINEDCPFLDTRLEDGSRMAVVYPPASPLGPTLTIRKFHRHFTLPVLIESNMISEWGAQFLIDRLADKKNVAISGGTGTGKTTLLNALCGEIPASERIITIEKPIELRLDGHPCVERWEAIDPLPGRPEITVSQLLRAALRHRPDRIIVGEVRDASAYDMLQAMNTGHGGTLSTVHADSANRALHRIASLAKAGFGDLSIARQETAEAIDYVVHVNRMRDGARVVSEIVQVDGYDQSGEQFAVKSITKETNATTTSYHREAVA